MEAEEATSARFSVGDTDMPARLTINHSLRFDLHPNLLRRSLPFLDPLPLLLPSLVGQVDVNFTLYDHTSQPIVLQHLLGRRTLVRVEVEHGLKEGFKFERLLFSDQVLVHEDRVQRPKLELVNVLELPCVANDYSNQLASSSDLPTSRLTFPREDLRAELAAQGYRARERTHQLNNLSDVVVILVVPRSRMRIEEVVASEQLEKL